MTTPSDLTLANHEAAHAQEQWVLLKWCGYQAGLGTMPGRALWNVVAGPYTVGSTVTIETMIKAGYRCEVVL
jgi:hypothetical protein